MRVFRASTFRADRPWGAADIANMGGITTRLHWTDRPYEWHVNDGAEVFAAVGTEHVAHPIGEARFLVVERAGSA